MDLQTLSLCTLFLVLFVPTTEGRALQPITCSADYDPNNRSVKLTCLYHKDLRQRTESYSIRFCPDYTGTSDCPKAISCNWANDSLFCVPTDRFEGMTCRLSDWFGNLTCHLTHVRSDHSGLYSCQLLNSEENREEKTCRLKVPETGTEAPQLTTPPLPTMTCPSPTIEKCDAMFRLLVANVVISVLVLLLLVIVIVLYGPLSSLRERMKTHREPNNELSNMEPPTEDEQSDSDCDVTHKRERKKRGRKRQAITTTQEGKYEKVDLKK